MQSNSFIIQADQSGFYNSQFPIFLQGTQITPAEYKETIDQCSYIYSSTRKTMATSILIQVTIFVFAMIVGSILAMFIIGIPIIFIAVIWFMVYILLFYPKIYAAGKKQLSEYVELENNSKYIPKGVQIMLKPRQIAVYHPGHYSNGSYHSGGWSQQELLDLEIVWLNQQQMPMGYMPPQFQGVPQFQANAAGIGFQQRPF